MDKVKRAGQLKGWKSTYNGVERMFASQAEASRWESGGEEALARLPADQERFDANVKGETAKPVHETDAAIDPAPAAPKPRTTAVKKAEHKRANKQRR